MTVSISFLNDQTKRSAVYFDRSDLDRYTLLVTTDAREPLTVPSVRIRFPLRIFSIADVSRITVVGWSAQAAGPMLTLTPASGSASLPLMIALTGVKSANTAATNDDLQVFVGTEAPTTKLFLMRYPAEAGDLTKAVLVKVLPPTIYRTPSDFDKIENVLTLRLSNANPATPLVTDPWARTPAVRLSFVYGSDIGSLTPADPPGSDPNSAFNITVDAVATYKDGKRSYEWTTTPPDSDGAPAWTLRPVSENRAVLGAGAGATAEFRISHLSTAAPAGATLAYLQFSDFPGYSDTFITLQLAKEEPQPSIIYFDGTPNYVAALGDPVTLQWQTFAMAKVVIQQGGQPLEGALASGHGIRTVNIDRTTDFALLAYKRADDAKPAHIAQWTGHVPDAQVVAFTADQTTVADGSPVVLSWSTRFARSAEIQSDTRFVIDAPSRDQGSKTYFPRRPTTYTLHVTGQGDPPDRQVKVFVLQRGWFSRRMGLSPHAGQGPLLYGTDNGLVLVGGQSDNAVFLSADGMQWDQVGVAQFPARNDAAGCAFGGKFWIMGGLRNGQPSNDVWCSNDGVNWTQTTASAPWPARSQHAAIGFKDKLWIFAGLDQNFQVLGDAWYSTDGAAWTQAGDGTGRWAPRSGPALAESQGRLWLFGGKLADDSVTGDLWASGDGAKWTAQTTGDPISDVGARRNATLGSLGGALYLFGGIDAQGAPLNDLNVFDGDSWGLETGPGSWKTTRAGFAIWKQAFWFAGGRNDGADSDLVWSWFPG